MNHLKISIFGTMACLLGLGFSDTANGQTITTSPSLGSGMSFVVQSGGAQGQQNLTISTSIDPTTLVVTVPSNSGWLKVNGVPSGNVVPFPNSPVTLPVQVNTIGLSQGETVQANIQISINNRPDTLVNFPVSLTVGGTSLLSSSPANISFSAVQGNSFGSPTSVPVTISSSGQALDYNATASTTSGGTWLLLTNTQSIPTNSTSPGFSVSVNASALTAGTYQGQVTVQSTTTGDSVIIPVTLSVTLGAALNVTPTTLSNFIYQYGSGQAGFQAETQYLMISTSSGSLNYQITASADPTSALQTTNWLVVSPNGGLATSTPQQVALSLSYSGLANLAAGTYIIDLDIAPTAGGGTGTIIPVTLVISSNGILTANNTSLTFTLPFGSTTTQSQTLTLSSSNSTNVPYTAQSNATWLTVSPTTGSTVTNPALTITVNDSGLTPSTTPYAGTVTLYPQNSDYGHYTVVINVMLNVTSATSTVYAAPDALLFSYEQSQTSPGLQEVQLTSTSTVSFTVNATQTAASNCPTSNWISLSANQSVTPATLSVGIVTTGMTSGFCTGNIQVVYNNGSSANTTVNIPVTVNIAASTPLLTVTPDPNFGVVTATVGSSSVTQSHILIGSTDGSALGYTAFASTPNSPVSWLSLGSSQGTSQNYITVFIVPTGLTAGVYTGSISINATAGSTLPSGSFTIPVVLTVSSSTTVAVSPTTLTFTQPQGATTASAAQTINLTATGGSTGFTATITPITGGTWLQISPSSGTATGAISASVTTNTLSVGTYTSQITIKFLNAATPTITIPVSLVITAAETVTVSPTTGLTFSYQLGSAAPATQTLNVTSTGGAVPITATATSTPAWLSVTPASGSTGATGSPLALTVSVNTSVLTAAQTYSGSITITPQGQAAITVPVSLIVTAVSTPSLVTITNAASGTSGVIAPGELITIKGTNLGPTTATSFSVGTGGTVSNTLGGVQVMFGSVAGTPIYVSPTQINVIVPYEIAGQPTTSISVIYSGVQSTAITYTVANQAPGIFTDSSTGSGQASVTNQNGSLNGPTSGITIGTTNVATSPAPEGSVISVYMTGGGQTSPASTTGSVTPGGTTLYKIPGTVTATIGGLPATVEFAGAAPGEVTGVIQVNLLVPTGVSGGTLPITVTINGATAAGPTVAVQ